MKVRETTMKENPRFNFKAAIMLIPASRQRQLPMNQLSCGIQSANISLVNRHFFVSITFQCPILDG